MHRLLPPSAIAGVSVVCALGPWAFSEPTVLRGLAAAAAATAVIGAVVLRRWDTQAGKQVADLTRARASDEWRHEERVAELETDLEESRELRVKLEQRLRAKRAELAGLRNEHAALLRRYATAETERATALEGRRLLEIEATTTPARALPPVPAQASAPEEETDAVAASGESAEQVDAAEDEQTGQAEQVEPVAPAVFSPEGSKLFLRAKVALAKFDTDSASKGDAEAASKGDADAAPKGNAEAASKGDAEAASKGDADSAPKGGDDAPKGSPDDDGSPKGGAPGGQEPVKAGAGEAVQEDEAQGKPEAVDGHERATATSMGKSAPSAQQPSGHFTVPTAVAVVPASPVRRPAVEGGFDFFGTKTELESEAAALEAVQNEDLADVVGQEALALHKAETEAEFKPADAESRGVGQVIDLTAHDETEQIDVQGLRSAAS
ncbi:hypothetical protein QQY66_27880 [Streptomyces sp. DG2A-72]|uniref:hypothetical protein n=1 Tax=Streptomyces sp. DG2A-72 TaxID=3051386 RepID=UPI00265C3BDB|nr:hypothetical protein [Streptomyces sp. DG2A-72]MDO0935303.1 hypothetical protein [Streptomyces sp. DG2A-72]